MDITPIKSAQYQNPPDRTTAKVVRWNDEVTHVKMKEGLPLDLGAKISKEIMAWLDLGNTIPDAPQE